MTVEWILIAWTVVGLCWWVIAFALSATATVAPRATSAADRRKISFFKTVPAFLGEKDLAGVGVCLESFVAQLDDASELLIGCDVTDGERLARLVERFCARYPQASIELIVHSERDRDANPKVGSMRALARHATGELWYWSDADIVAPSELLRSLRQDFAASDADVITSPYLIRGTEVAPQLLDKLFVNLEFYPGVVLLGRLDLIRFGFGSGMLFEAGRFEKTVDWDELGCWLADDYHLGKRLGRVRLGSTRLTTVPGPRNWTDAVLHYLKWQKTIRWCQPAAFAAQLIVIPVIGWLAYLLSAPTHPVAWTGLAAAVAVDTGAALAVCRVLDCSVRWRWLPGVAVWSILRALVWIACWLPWPIVWRDRKWWSPRQAARTRLERFDTDTPPAVE